MRARFFFKPFGATFILLTFAFVRLGQAAPGDPDTSFAGTGIIQIPFGGGDDFGRALTLQADGKVVVAGYSSSGGGSAFAVVRYGADNLLDGTFGNGGKVLTPVGSTSFSNGNANAVRIQADGKIVVAGWADNGGTRDWDFAVARYNTDGSLDTSFNGGIVTTDLGGRDRGEALLIQPDGKILVAGTIESGPGFSGVVRYNTNGIPDTSWNGTGQVTTSLYFGAQALAYQSFDGKILVAGRAGFGNMSVARYNDNGTPDTSFGTGGITNATTGDSSGARAVAIQPGNNTIQNPDKIVVAGYALIGGQFDFALARFNLDGTRDMTFDGDGVVTTAIGSGDDIVEAIMFTGTLLNRRIVVAGNSHDGARNRIAVARYNLAGAPDNGFDTDGKVITSIGPGNDEAYSMTLHAGGILVAGSSLVTENNHDFALVRYNGGGSLDSSYDEDGIKLQDVSDLASAAQSVAIQPDGKMVVAGNVSTRTGSVFALARVNTDGSLDASFGQSGKVTTPIGTDSSASAVALQPDGKIIAGGSSGREFALARYEVNGAPDSSFGMGGQVTATNGSAAAIALQPDGRIVVAGTSTNDDFAVLRFNTNGTPDTSFDGDGRVTTAIGAGRDGAVAVKIQSNGKIIVAGAAEVNMNLDFALARYNTNGSLDNSFGSFGRVATDIASGSHDLGIGLALQPDGRMVLAGYTINPANQNIDVAVARYLTNGVPDNSFDGDGKLTTPIGLSADLGTSVALQADGRIVVGGIATIGADAHFSVVRYNTDGSLDGSYGSGGKAVVPVGNGAFTQGIALALDAQGRAVLAGRIGEHFGVVRVLGDPYIRILSITRSGDGQVNLEGVGVPNATHTIESSGNLNPGSFGALGSVSVNAQGLWQYQDTSASGLGQRFYRLSSP